MQIFLKENHKFKGIHRLVEGYTIHPEFSLKTIPNISKANDYKNGDKAIFAGFTPGEVAKDTTFEKKYYVFCSPYGQAELSGGRPVSPEMGTFLDVHYYIKQGDIAGMISPAKSFEGNPSTIFLQSVKLGIEDYIGFNASRANYGFLGNNYRLHRNIVNQISAISKLEPKEKIVVADKDFYNSYIPFFECEFISPKLDTDEKYYKEIATHILGFQCSFSESFNYVALEYAFMGVPCVVSPCIDWYPISELMVWNNDSAPEIYKTAQEALDDQEFYKWASYHLKEWAVEWNNENKIKLTGQLEELLKI